MLWKIIALAVAGLMSGAAFAQSNVTIYGGIDLSVAVVDPSSGPTNRLVLDNGVYTSRLGFKGTEDLGNGLKASFVLENGLTPGAPSDGFGSAVRQSYIALSGSFGEVAIGHMSHLTHLWSGAFDYAGNFTAATDAGLRTAKTSDGVNRYGNSLRYISPNLSGFTLGYAHAMDEVAGSNADRNQYAAKYENGPINVQYAYTTVGNGAGAKAKANWFGAAYNFGSFKLMGEYTNNKAANASDKGKFWMLGGVIPVGKGNVHLGTGAAENPGDTKKAKSYEIAYTYGLSKRTTAYAGYMHNSTGTGSSISPLGTTVGTANSANIYAAGLIHTF